ncbi:MAG: hypothetical protein WDZ59_03330 [Pirellulales bacterium]
MNWQHVKAILHLRWRLSVNRWKRSGTLNTIVMFAIVVMALSAVVWAFLGALLIGIFVLRDSDPDQLLLIWDAVVVAFVFFWMIGLVTELQRSESLSLEKLLHLPISLTGTFLLNYLTSLLSLSMIVFLPLMAGLSIAMAVVKGPAMLITWPLLATFILMVTAVTYQFRGWLATLMLNKRRRRTIIALVTVGFILLAQIPNIVSLAVLQPRHEQAMQEYLDELEDLQKARDAESLGPQEYAARVKALSKQREEAEQRESEQWFRKIVDGALVVNVVLPIGWLPYGARAAALGNLLPGILGSLGAALIGAASLWRSYRSTLRYYTGGYQSGRSRVLRAKVVPATTTLAKTKLTSGLLERQLGPISEHASAVALASFRSLTRAPEAKMMMLTPVIMLVIFGSMLFSRAGQNVPDLARPLMGFGAILLTMLGLVQLMQNLFGFDRDGFRVYVLTPAKRRDILLGKNLSILPLAFGMCLICLTALQLVVPMRVSHLLATLVQVAVVYVVFCMAGNLISILAPFPVKAGSMQAAKPSVIGILIQFICMLILYPLALIPTLLPLGVDLLLEHLGRRGSVPVYLLLSLVELVIILYIYKHVLVAQGSLLQRREQKILARVTVQAD